MFYNNFLTEMKRNDRLVILNEEGLLRVLHKRRKQRKARALISSKRN